MTGETGSAAGGPGRAGRVPRVLVVEDDEGIAGLWVEALAGAGFAAERVGSALGLTAVLRARPPDAIVLDLGRPFRSGGALLGDLKADPATAAIPVVVVSGAPEALPRARAALAAAVLTKPAGPGRLCAAVAAAVARAAG
jgi:DNA-binding response OmpR family regulator